MSTRSTTHFIGGCFSPVIVYRHSDGYPEGAGTDIYRFLAEVKQQTQDTRFGDSSYLAAKYVVWLAAEFAPYSSPWKSADDWDSTQEARAEYAKTHPLNFISVGIMATDPDDIEYRYIVDCSKFTDDGEPTITCIEIGWDSPDHEVSIPRPTEAVTQ